MRPDIAAAVVSLVLALPLGAQTIRGTLIDRLTRRPLINVPVSAQHNNLTVVRGETDSSGTFSLLLPSVSLYVVAFGADGNSQLYSEPFVVPPGDTLQRTFAIELGTVYDEKVDAPAWPLLTNVRVPYPEAMRLQRAEGEVQLRFIIDSSGAVRPGSVKILQAANPGFNDVVLRSIYSLQYRPAVLKGVKVAQIVKQSFIFKLSDQTGMLRAP